MLIEDLPYAMDHYTTAIVFKLDRINIFANRTINKNQTNWGLSGNKQHRHDAGGVFKDETDSYDCIYF
jgi:hypothetical protein